MGTFKEAQKGFCFGKYLDLITPQLLYCFFSHLLLFHSFCKFFMDARGGITTNAI